MLEATIVLELAMGKVVEGIVIAVLLLFNASFSLFRKLARAALLSSCRSDWPCAREFCATPCGD